MHPDAATQVSEAVSIMRRVIAAGVTAGVLWRLRHRLALACTVLQYSFMVWLVDVLPHSVRKSILEKEYEGEMLERRLTQRIFKGTSTVRALWRMSSINLRPRTCPGKPAPPTPVVLLDSDRPAVLLHELAHDDRPLVLNFGSCT